MGTGQGREFQQECHIWVGKEEVSNITPYGPEKTRSSSNQAIDGHMWAGQRGSVRNNTHVGTARQEVQKPRPMWVYAIYGCMWAREREKVLLLINANPHEQHIKKRLVS